MCAKTDKCINLSELLVHLGLKKVHFEFGLPHCPTRAFCLARLALTVFHLLLYLALLKT